MSSKGKLQRYCEAKQVIHFTTYFSQLTSSSSPQGKFFEEDKYKEVRLEEDVKERIVDFYKEILMPQTHNMLEERYNICSDDSNSMDKDMAMALFSHKNYELHSSVTFASTNKTTGEFWANPNPEYIKQDWSFILNDKKKRKLYLLEISKNTFRSGDIPDRDNGRLHIVLDPHTLINTAPDKTNFAPHKIAEISY